jgi:hypothetical protein
MAQALNNVTTADGYTPANTLSCPGAQRFVIHARNAMVGYQLGHGWPTPQWEIDERSLPPGSLGRSARVDAIRVRSWTPGKPAQVTIDTVGGA